MEKKWIDPTEIYVYEVLNNRDLNQNYIIDITESMTDKGFLPEFPIDVFRSENLVNIETKLPYVCACGAHRTIAATKAKLEKVLAHIHDGREEAFIEMMHLDNFKFDPAQNTGIGQPFTNKEKRAAVTQLLLLPKFFEQTNAALSELWNIPDTNIRRWRDEVVELLEMNSPKLRLWAVSDGRLARLRELAASTERKDAEGKIVKIRQKYVDASDDEKSDFWHTIKDDVIELAAKLEDEGHETISEDDVRKYLGTDSYWYPYKDVTMRQLQQVHQLILDADADFIQACLEASRIEKERKAQENAFEEAVDRCQTLFKKTYAPQEDKYSPAYGGMRGRFRDFIRSQDEKYANFEMNYYDYDSDFRSGEDVEKIEATIALHHVVIAAIENEEDWLQGFMDYEEKTLKKQRKAVESDWRKQRQALIAAIQAYPRPVGEPSLLYKADAFLRQDAGTLEKLLATEAPSAKKFTATIESEANNFKNVAYAIKNDASWVQEIPVPKALVEVFPEVVAAREEAEQEAPVLQPEDVLQSLSLKEILRHVKDRVIYIPVEDESQVRMELAQVLGSASRGQTGTQLYLLMDYALFVYPKENREGFVIEKDGEDTE